MVGFLKPGLIGLNPENVPNYAEQTPYQDTPLILKLTLRPSFQPNPTPHIEDGTMTKFQEKVIDDIS
jgi:hypothetical protein